MIEQTWLSSDDQEILGGKRRVLEERLEESDDQEPTGTEEPVGAWSEELDVAIYADTSLTLPGMGDPGKNCGDPVPVEYCEECGEPHFSTVSCDQRQCPDCWESWKADRAEGIVRRLAAARRAAGEGIERRVVHGLVSPEEGSVRTLSQFGDMMSEAYDILSDQGVRGGVAIPHGWRVLEEVKEEWARATDGGESGPALWAWIRAEYGEAWREAVYWSPHVHVLALAPAYDYADPEDNDGYVSGRIRTLSEWSLLDPEGYEDMARTASYILSHSAYEPQSNTDSVRWFGDLHPSNFSPDPESGEIQEPALESLSEGTYKTIERYAREAVGLEAEEREEPPECRREECHGRRLSIHKASEWLQDEEWCNHIGRDQQKRLETALDWLCGDARPPPGLRHPQTTEQAHEALEAMLPA